MQSQPMPDPDKFAIGAIFKNERPYILEWIAFHRTIGIKKFLIGDNDSTDGSKDLLRLLDLAGIIHYFDFPSEPGVKPQLQCYSKILKLAKDLGLEWVAFIDADEFLMPESVEMDFFSCIQKPVSQQDTGAVAINWAIYGSSGLVERHDGLVLKDFTKRATADFPGNLHYKSLVKLEAVSGVSGSPHHFLLTTGFKYKNAQGLELENHLQNGIGYSSNFIDKPIIINHYAIKSKGEFLKNKSLKGSAASPGAIKKEAYFKYHDRNDEYAPCNSRYIEKIIIEIAELESYINIISKFYIRLKNLIVSDSFRLLKAYIFNSQELNKELPEYFNPLHYLLLNPDVFIAGADPVQHYLEFGKKENRKYQL